MDIHQLRSWIFELYEPLEDERQYIVFDRARGNLLIDAPAFSERALRLIRGAGSASVLLITNGARGADAAKYRDALGLQIAAHADDAGSVPGGADLLLKSEELVRPDARVIRVGEDGDGATVVLGRKSGGVLFCGDLDLSSDAAAQLTKLDFSSVLSARRSPIWNAGRDTLQLLQRELPQPRKRFGILLQAPWDRAYKGRLQDLMRPNPLIVPDIETAAREAAMGPGTLVVANQVRERTEAAPRPTRKPEPAREPAAVAAAATANPGARPRNFAEDWSAPATPVPPTTVANASGALVPDRATYQPVALGSNFARLDVNAVASLPSVDAAGGVDLSPDGAEVVFAWDQSGAYELYAAPIADEQIIQLTESGARSVSPRWSPDGGQIAFLRDVAATGRSSVWVVDHEGTVERRLTVDDAASYRDIEWAPDGRSIVCTAMVGDKRSGIRRIDVGSGTETPLTDDVFDDARPMQSPDGRWIAFSSRRDSSRVADLYVMPAAGGDAVKLDTRDGKSGDSTNAAWSPDSRTIAFTTHARGRSEIALIDWDGHGAAGLRYLTEDPFDELDPVWRPDGRGLIYLQDKGATRAIHRVFTASRAETPVLDLPGVYGAPRIGPDSETIVATFSSANRPTDVWVREGDQLTMRALTSSMGTRGTPIDARVLVEPVPVHYPGASGREVAALLYVPHAEAIRTSGPPHPAGAVLRVPADAAAPPQRGWDPLAQLLANRGLMVLEPATGDAADVLAGADWLVHEGLTDPGRIGITGPLTVPILETQPDRFAAGVASTNASSRVTIPLLVSGERAEELDAIVAWFTRHLTPMMDRYLAD